MGLKEVQVFSICQWFNLIEKYFSDAVLGKCSFFPGAIPYWINTREIRIFWETGINESTAKFIHQGIVDYIGELGLDGFNIRMIGTEWKGGDRHIKADDYIRPALVKYARLDYPKLFTLSYNDPCRQCGQYADIFITSRVLSSGRETWGAARFASGSMILALHSFRQLKYRRARIKNVLRHEMGHLLGVPIHCDTAGVQGWRHESSCNMHGSAPSPDLCFKCRTFIGYWWTLIARVDKKYFLLDSNKKESQYSEL